jgi:cytoskeletal protein CcmA (bactofilin family)
MFKEKNHTSGEKGLSNSATLIAPGTILKGDVKSDNDLRIDGTIQGNVKCSSKIIIGPNGFVEGNIEGANADVIGRVKGNVQVKELLQLREKGNIEGNVIANKLQIDPSAVFNGKCQMGAAAASVVAMGKQDVQQQQAAEAK